MKIFSPIFLILTLIITPSILVANGPGSYPTDPVESDYITYYKEGNLVIKKYIGKSATLTIPHYIDSVKVFEIESYAFFSNTSLKKIYIPSGIRKIGDYAFKLCDSLESVTFEASELTIGNAAFAECSSLKEIIIPEGTDTIGSYAFSNCKELSKVTVLDTDVIYIQEADSCNIFNKKTGKVDNIFIGYDGSTTELLAKQMNYSFSPILENSGTTAIENTQTNLFKVYPTIIDRSKTMSLNIETNGTSNDRELSIYNTNGILILKQMIQQNSSKVNLANTSISQGTYIVTLSSNTSIQSNKIIVR